MALKFGADNMLGGLAKWLRILGFDTCYLRQGLKEPMPDRTLLTCRSTRPHQPLIKGWLDVIHLSSNRTQAQLKETMEILRLKKEDFQLLSRCTVCNHLLEKVPREDVSSLVPEYVHASYTEFSRCGLCGRIYWPGTHQGRMLALINELKSDPDFPGVRLSSERSSGNGVRRV